MPTISVYMIRSSLLYLAAGFVIGGLLLFSKATGLFRIIWLILPIHIEFVVFGWILQLTLGVAYWIFPRYIEGKPRGNPALAWLIFGLMNAGILLQTAHIVLWLPGWTSLLARILELGSVVAFVALHWNRVVSYKNLHG